MNFSDYSIKKAAIITVVAISIIIVSAFELGHFSFAEEEGGGLDNLSASIAPMRLPVAGSTLFAMASNNPDYNPIRNWGVGEPEMTARAAFVIIPGKSKILFKKNIEEQMPIASITKAMTAVIALEESGLTESTMVRSGHVMTEGESGNLLAGEEFSLGDLLKIMMITSSNDAAEVVAEFIGDKLAVSEGNILKSSRDIFIERMNQKALDWNLIDTSFVTPTGLVDEGGFSTAKDIASLAERIMLEYPFVWDVSGAATLDVQDLSGWNNHHLVNTNKLLRVFEDIIGGKTGYTDGAKECIVLIQERPGSQESIIYVVLGSDDRFADAKKLMNWVDRAYMW